MPSAVWIEAYQIRKPEGTIQVFEKDRLPFLPKRIFWITDVPKLAKRGGHAHKECSQFIFCVNGGVEIKVDGVEEGLHINQDSWHGVLIPPMHWIDIRFLRPKSKIVVLASHEYNENEYLRSYDEFKRISNSL